MSTIQKLKDQVGMLQKKLSEKNTKAAQQNKVLSEENLQLKTTIDALQVQVTELTKSKETASA